MWLVDFQSDTWPQQVGRLIAIALLLGAAALLWLRQWALRRFARRIWMQNPPRIGLVRNDHAPWKNPEAVRSLVEPLRQAGFEDAGTFEIQGIPGAKIVALVKPSEGVHATVHERPRLGAWLDMVTRFQDGSRLLHTTHPKVILIKTHPGNRGIRMVKAGALEVYRKHMADRPARPTKPVTAAEYPAYFVRSHAEGMDHLSARGAPGEEQVRATLRTRRNRELPDSLIRIARDVLARKAVWGLDVALRDRFAEASGLPPGELERVRPQLVCVHDKMSTDDVVDLFNLWVEGEHAASRGRPLSAHPRRAFAALNEQLPAELRYRKLGELDEPVPADVYVPAGCPCDVQLESDEILLTVPDDPPLVVMDDDDDE